MDNVAPKECRKAGVLGPWKVKHFKGCQKQRTNNRDSLTALWF
jgi:hypothetical protein